MLIWKIVLLEEVLLAVISPTRRTSADRFGGRKCVLFEEESIFVLCFSGNIASVPFCLPPTWTRVY